MNMAADDVIHLEALYPYAYQGRDMFAITSPFRMEPDKLELVGRRVAHGAGGVHRQIDRPRHPRADPPRRDSRHRG